MKKRVERAGVSPGSWDASWVTSILYQNMWAQMCSMEDNNEGFGPAQSFCKQTDRRWGFFFLFLSASPINNFFKRE